MVVDQDPLGVGRIYVQAKRYTEGKNTGAGDIHDFFGALDLKKVQKGESSSLPHHSVQVPFKQTKILEDELF